MIKTIETLSSFAHKIPKIFFILEASLRSMAVLSSRAHEPREK